MTPWFRNCLSSQMNGELSLGGFGLNPYPFLYSNTCLGYYRASSLEMLNARQSTVPTFRKYLILSDVDGI